MAPLEGQYVILTTEPPLQILSICFNQYLLFRYQTGTPNNISQTPPDSSYFVFFPCQPHSLCNGSCGKSRGPSFLPALLGVSLHPPHTHLHKTWPSGASCSLLPCQLEPITCSSLGLLTQVPELPLAFVSVPSEHSQHCDQVILQRSVKAPHIR